MTPELAARHLVSIDRAWDGAVLCRQRLLDIDASTAVPIGNGWVFHDVTEQPTHDADYYAWEAVRVVKIAQKAVTAGLRGKDKVIEALDALRQAAPGFEALRDSVTHVEDNRGADDVAYFPIAVRLLPDGGAEYPLDPRYEHHDLLGDLVAVTKDALTTLAAKAAPKESGPAVAP